jgi:endonuclease-8
MEGPSLKIIREEMKPFEKLKVKEAHGTAALEMSPFVGASLKKVSSWGKHLILELDKTILRIHFLMFGSYRINDSRDREPKLHLTFAKGYINFYSCSVKIISKDELKDYDWSLDLMADDWDEKRVVKMFRSKPKALICDVLMDQSVFPGLGNIIKNEVLFRLRLHPELSVDDLSSKQQLALVRDTRTYSLLFYEWKKINQLKKNWKIFRKRKCPTCKSDLEFRQTGVLQRVSYICEVCQPFTGAQRPTPIPRKPRPPRQWPARQKSPPRSQAPEMQV